MTRRVVVTGMGVVAPIGVGLAAFEAGLRAGRSGTRLVRHWACDTFPNRLAGEVDDVALEAALAALGPDDRLRLAGDRKVVQFDKTRWDYKHQVLAMSRIPPWRLFLWVKFIEAVAQLRPRALMRLAWNPDPKIRHAIRWYYRMGRRVWLHEIASFLARDRYAQDGRTLAEFLGEPQDAEEEASRTALRPGTATRG